MRATRNYLALGISLILAASTAPTLHAQEQVAAAPEPSLDADASLAKYREKLEKLNQVLTGPDTAEKWTLADKAMGPVLKDPMFGRLSSLEQGRYFSIAARVAVQVDQYERARELFAKATQLDPGTTENWLEISWLEHELGRLDAAAAALTTYARKSPESLDEHQNSITYLIRAMDPDSNARLELLQTLFDANWKALPLDASDAWYELALTRVLRGEPEAARVVIARITWPEMLARLRSDKRFDGLFDRDAEQFNVERAASRRVDALKVHTLVHPSHLQNVVELTYAMFTEGMSKAVLELTDGVLKGIAKSQRKVLFADMDRLPWIMNNRAIALHLLGRTDEALVQLQSAALLEEDGHANISQVLNLGSFHCGLGQGNEALAALAKIGSPLSESDRAALASVKHCIAVLQGDRRGEKHALATLRKHRSSQPSFYLDALLRSNRMDDAAKTVIERLASKHERGEMLFDMQDFLQPKPLPGNVPLHERRKQLWARDDVREALDMVGRIEHYEVYSMW